MTADEEGEFLEYAKSSILYNLFVFILDTGLRASEACALRHQDVVNGEIKVIRQCHRKEGGGVEFAMPKTASGIRTVPLSQEAADAIRRQDAMTERKRARHSNHEMDVWDNPDYDDIIFRTSHGRPYTVRDSNKAIRVVIADINAVRGNRAVESGEAYIPFKSISIHCLRHTFASKCARRGMNPKTLQSIMGHASITVTMDIYAHADVGAVKEEFAQIMGGGVKVE